MKTATQLTVTEGEMAKNPAIDPKVVSEAEQTRRELERLGVWKEIGSRVRSPFETTPDIRSHRKKMAQLVAQAE